MQAAPALTERDIERLKADPSPATRLDTAKKVSAVYRRNGLAAGEREIAEDIIGLLVLDVAVEVREALSHSLKHCPFLPRALALSLARDVDSVAIPMLQFSEALTDADLIEILRSAGLRKRLAIARRRQISRALADALIARSREEEVAITMLSNAGAAITEAGLNNILDIHGGSTRVHGPMVRRGALPATVVERLVGLVSEELCQYLMIHHRLPAPLATAIGRQARERAVLGLIPGEKQRTGELRKLILQLGSENKLTPTLLLRALCDGRTAFFEEAMALHTRLPADNARKLLRDCGPLGLKALYQQAGLPEHLFPAFRIATNVVILEGLDGNDEEDRSRRRARIMEGLLKQYEHIGPGDLDATLYKLSA
ncbi:MAG: DUF2336 domain-containing protein [Alphaproteobacteria bacterium]|nr:DUF2336 domain-containing protein [Alphaproteobacteria bacterium]